MKNEQGVLQAAAHLVSCFAKHDFEKYFDLDISYKNKSFTTLAGLILHKTAYIPNVGDSVTVHNLKLEVVDKDGQRIDKVMVTKI